MIILILAAQLVEDQKCSTPTEDLSITTEKQKKKLEKELKSKQKEIAKAEKKEKEKEGEEEKTFLRADTRADGPIKGSTRKGLNFGLILGSRTDYLI